MTSFFATLRTHWISIALVAVLAVGASAVATYVQPFEYRAAFSLLVIEKEGSLDGYAAAKSAERLSISLGNLIATDAFTDQVFQRLQASNVPADPNLFAADGQERRRAWKRQVETRVFPDVGQLKIAVYHKDRNQATLIADTLALVMVEQGATYLGGQNVVLKTVDYPLTSKRPARPNVPMNLVLGALLGAVAATGVHLAHTRRPVASRAEKQETTLARHAYETVPLEEHPYTVFAPPPENLPGTAEPVVAAPEIAPMRWEDLTAVQQRDEQEPQHAAPVSTAEPRILWEMP